MTTQRPKARRFAIAVAASLAALPAAVPANSADPLHFPDWPQVLQRTADGRTIDDDRRMTMEGSRNRNAPGDSGTGPTDAIAAVAHEDPIRSRPVEPEGGAPKGLSDGAGPETRQYDELHPDGPASGKPGRRPSPTVRVGATPVHPDPVTGSRIRILAESGLLARQSEISESIMIMERQIRQAELLNKLMALKGPEASI